MYKWVRALRLLRELELPKFNGDLTQHDLLESYTLNRIADEGLIHAREVESNDLSYTFSHEPEKLKKLNEEQQAAFGAITSAIDEEIFKSFLLYGVTGSGKTEVYIHALKKVLQKGQGGLVLVPEIGLTPQIVRRFYQIFGDDIAVLHSRLTRRERYDAWQALQKGEKRIAIGARSERSRGARFSTGGSGRRKNSLSSWLITASAAAISVMSTWCSWAYCSTSPR